MKILGYILFAAGVLVGISGAAKLPPSTYDRAVAEAAGETYAPPAAPTEPGGEWPDSLPVALGGIVVGILGVTLWHLALRKERQAARRGEDGQKRKKKSAVELLQSLLEPARALRAEAASLEPKALEDRTDQLLEDYVLPFAEVRQQMIDRFGMAKGADILVTVAYGERLLNRVWSAAADGHQEEAVACVPEAIDAFEEAARMLEHPAS